MRLPLYQVDAFTSEVFAGNPAAVVLLEGRLPDETLQAIALENNLSETAFLLRRGAELLLRWFTPTVEVDLCGHATLATAFVLFWHDLVAGDEVRFQTVRAGELVVTRQDEWVRLDFPSRPPEPGECTEELVAVLGARPAEVQQARDVMAVFDSEEEVRALAPRFAQMAELDAYAVIATAPGREVDFVSRFFAPRQGINEDPVTGSAHCTLTPYWARRLGKQQLTGRQVSQRGGEVLCEDQGERAWLSGRAVEYLKGEIVF